MQFKSEFDSELSEGTNARYEYWPKVEKEFPLLYYCAAQLLAGDTNATCFSERMHSPAGRISSKFRASMLPDKTERLTLAYFLVRMQIEQADARGRLDATELDEAELLAEQEEGEADSEPGAPAVVVVSEGSGSESDDHLDDHVPGGAAAGAAAH